MLSSIFNGRLNLGRFQLSNIIKNYNSIATNSIRNTNYRSWLFVSKTDEGLIKASRSNADVVVLDLEDSVPMNLKSKMREKYLESIKDGLFARKNLFIRLNDITDYDELIKDVETMTVKGVAGFLLPKTENASSLRHIEKLISKQEDIANFQNGFFQLAPIIETPAAYYEARHIASASDRNIALICGDADFLSFCRANAESSIFDALASEVIIAARTANIMAISGVCDLIDDHTAAERLYSRMKNCGFNGANAITLDQVGLINNAFAPSPKEVHWAETVHSSKNISTYQQSIQHSRQMVGPPHLRKAKDILSFKEKFPQTNHLCLYPTTPVTAVQDSISIGKIVGTPMELTITEFWKGTWESSFLTTNPYVTSMINIEKANISEVPFLMLNLLALAMSVSTFSEAARVHLGCYDAKQVLPVKINDTLRNRYYVHDAKHKVDSNKKIQYTIVYTTHELLNQRDEIVFTVSKRTMFGPLTIKNKNKVPDKLLWKNQTEVPDMLSWKNQDSFLKEHEFNENSHGAKKPNILTEPTYKKTMLKESKSITSFNNVTYVELKPNDLLLHKDCKVYGTSETRSLCTLFKIVNEHHHNKIKHIRSEILVPGPLVIAGMISNAGRDIGTVLYEEYHCQLNINKVNFEDQLNTLSYVVDRQDIPGHTNLEEVRLKHIGIKNIDIDWLMETGYPIELFQKCLEKPSEFESICVEKCPLLYRKIACFAERTVIRLKPTKM